MFHCLWFCTGRHEGINHAAMFKQQTLPSNIAYSKNLWYRNCKVHWLRFLGGSWKWWRMVAVYAWSTSRRWAKVTLEEFIDGIMRCKGQAHLWQRRVISRREFWCCFVVFWNISTQVVCERAFIEPLSLTGYSGFHGGQSGDFVTPVNMCFRVTIF